MIERFVLLIAACIVLITSAASRAELITFEGHSGAWFNDSEFREVDGFRFTLTKGNPSGFLIFEGNNSDVIENGTRKLYAANHAIITMSRADGALFNLESVDVGGTRIASPNRWADSVNIFAGLNSVNIHLPSNDPTYQFAVLNFTSVTSVTFSPLQNPEGGANSWEYMIDNLHYTAVPEPNTVVLSGVFALGICGCFRFRRG